MNATKLCTGLATALLLAACGGDGGKPADDVGGADTSAVTDTTPVDDIDGAEADTTVTGCGIAKPALALCNPYPGCTSGCEAGAACTNVDGAEGENVVCQAGADVPVGGACDNAEGPFCASGACIRNECRQFCDVNSDCDNGTDCRSYQSGNMRVNVCGASEAIICDPFQPEVECAPGTSCYRDVILQTSTCLVTGSGDFGATCSCTGCCASGLTCTRDDAGETGICGETCVAGGSGERGCASRCAGRVAWHPIHDASTVAYCVPFESYTIVPVTVGSTANGDLAKVGENDVFSFQGQAGQVVRVALTTPGAAYDVNAIDSIVSIHKASDGEVVAIGDDAIFANAFDSAVVTVLPETGAYYVLVRDCWSYSAERPDKEWGCYLPIAKTTTSYTISVSDVTAATTVDPETGDTAADAVQLPVSGVSASTGALARGTFRNGTDVDVFRVTVPTNLPLSSFGGHSFRAQLLIRAFAAGVSGPYGSGSTTPIGEIRVTTVDRPTTVIARVGAADLDQVIQVPVEVGADYLVWVTPAADAAPTGERDFYLFSVLPERSLPVEGDAANDTIAEATAPTDVFSDDSDTYYQISGDIAPTPADVDFFSFPIAETRRQVSVVCWAASLGSGVQGLTVTFMKADGTPLPNGTAVDSQETPAIVNRVNMSTTDTQILLKVAAAGQAPDATATHYDCQVVVSVPDVTPQ